MEGSDLRNAYDISEDCGFNPDYKVRRKASVAGSLLERSLRLDCNWKAARAEQISFLGCSVRLPEELLEGHVIAL